MVIVVIIMKKKDGENGVGESEVAKEDELWRGFFDEGK